jgi:predicted dehydrogenase/threonine dehydrogenase-like Zn-dependent dehydrogenase
VKQVLLDPGSGRISVVETAAPSASPNRLLVRTETSALSPGTERQLVVLSSRRLLSKARARPEAARQVVETLRREGLRSALDKARARLEHPYPLGSSLVGTVVEVGAALEGPPPGTRVACTGAEIATHSEFVSVPPLLAVPVPDEVGSEDAAFAGIGAIAMHAARLAGVEPGGTGAVMGLGLLGQLVAQILAAGGAWTLGTDPDVMRREIASAAGVVQVAAGGDGAAAAVRARGGADAVVVAVGGTGPEAFREAIELCRDRGRIIVVGAVPLVLDRDAMYRKELSLVVARSSGAGRYDPTYEDDGVDLPPGHVRWTEGRNMAAFVDLIRQGTVSPSGLVTHRFGIEDAERAYALLEEGAEPSLGIVLRYGSGPSTPLDRAAREVVLGRGVPAGGRPRVAMVGAGSFARGVLLPRLKELPVELVTVATATGPSGAGTARRFRFARATTDAESAIDADDVDAVVVATRHDLHAALAARALRRGRSVYVEKPLGMSREELLEVCDALRGSKAILSVGFNRRWATLIRRLREELPGHGPITASYVVNGPPIPSDSWILHPELGGGVALAEGGHFIDTLAYLAGALPVSVSAVSVDPTSYQATVRFGDGSVGSITCSTGGGGNGPKELLTVMGRGTMAQLHDFRRLSLWRAGRRRTVGSRPGSPLGRQDKGHAGSLRAWVEAVAAGSAPPVPATEVLAVSEATLCLHEALRRPGAVAVDLAPYLEALAPPLE